MDLRPHLDDVDARGARQQRLLLEQPVHHRVDGGQVGGGHVARVHARHELVVLDLHFFYKKSLQYAIPLGKSPK